MQLDHNFWHILKRVNCILYRTTCIVVADLLAWGSLLRTHLLGATIHYQTFYYWSNLYWKTITSSPIWSFLCSGYPIPVFPLVSYPTQSNLYHDAKSFLIWVMPFSADFHCSMFQYILASGMIFFLKLNSASDAVTIWFTLISDQVNANEGTKQKQNEI